MRKFPQQTRSTDTVNTICEAAIQLLNTNQAPAFTTNHIAERAGVSVGTLYRYFPDKMAILRYLVRREIDHMRSHALKIISDSDATDTDTLLQEIIAFSNHKFGGREIAAFQAKRLIESDPLLLNEIRNVRIEVVKKLEERLLELTPKRKGPMSDAALAASVDAFIAATETLAGHNPTKTVDIAQKKQLLSSILDAMTR